MTCTNVLYTQCINSDFEIHIILLLTDSDEIFSKVADFALYINECCFIL